MLCIPPQEKSLSDFSQSNTQDPIQRVAKELSIYNPA